MSGTNMVWIPTVDGGSIQVPANDPRALALQSQRANSGATGSTGAQKNSQPSTKSTPQAAQQAAIGSAQNRFSRQYIQITVDLEYLNGTWEDPQNSLHDQRVISLIGLAIGLTDPRSNLQDRMSDARVIITNFRERSPRNAESVLLRDAERYLWGRAGIPEFSTQWGGWVSPFAPLVNNLVYTPIKAVCMAIDANFYTSWGKANPTLPFSPLGGDRWFQLGIQHYREHDEGRLTGMSDPYVPTTIDVAAQLFPGQANPGQIAY
jgi:hypothetical protein